MPPVTRTFAITNMPRYRFLLAQAALGLAALILPAAHAAPGPWDHAPYQLGQGLHFPDQGLDVGGYLSLQYENLHRRTSAFSVHDLSLFVNKRFDARWNVFTEMEVGDALKVTKEGHVSHHAEFDIERLYADYRVSPAVTLRFGKFLTPVGRWNMIHADPLVWTVSRPLTTAAAFARHATGAMIYGSLPAAGRDLDYWLFADDTAQLDPLQRKELAFDTPGSSLTLTNNFNRAAGGRLQYHFMGDRLSVGASYLYFEMQKHRGDRNLLGADFHWNTRYVELSGEAVYRTIAGSSRSDERGGFIQAVVPVPHHLYLVARHEHYHAAVLAAAPTLDTFGITYRPRPPISVKLEYRTGRNNTQAAPSGWLGSLAILF
jgi:hypothetical protein